MTGPGERERPPASAEDHVRPPGDFLSHELESDCARFLEDMRALVRRREQESDALPLRARV